jgi:hypothetical protein
MEKQKIKGKLIGKVAKLEKGSDAIKFMENIKIPRNKMWYVLVEKQDNELHMVKYNQDGVNANQFVADLKKHYINTFKNNKNIIESFEKIQIIGNDKFSIIKNVPDIFLGEKKLLSIITEDLIKLLK